MCVMPFVGVLLAFGIAAAPQSQPPARSNTSVVVGRVVDASTGRPVAGAIVTLFGSAAVASPRPGEGLAATPPRLMTNAAGQFVARGLRRGSLFLVVTKGGYVDATNAQRRPLGTAQRIEVRDGQRITDLEVRMWRYAVIAGTVLDEAGEPIVDARVQSYRRVFAAGHQRYVAGTAASTDDRGMYRLANVAPGEYQIAVAPTDAPIPNAPDGAALLYPTTFYPGSPSSAQASLVSVGSGEEHAGVDVQVQPARAVRVSGQVVAPTGYAGDIPVRLFQASDAGVVERDTANVRTDATGGFEFPLVPPGQYIVKVVRAPRPPVATDATAIAVVRSGAVAVATPAPPTQGPSPPPPMPPDSTLSAETGIAVGDASVTGVTLVLRPGPRVSGRVEFDGSGDRPDPMSRAYARVTLDPADGTQLPEGLGVATGRIDENGQFRTYGVPPGKYFVRVSALSDWFFRGAIYEGRDLADTPIEITTEDVSGVVLLFTDRPSSIAGTVRTGPAADGDAVVLAFPTDPSQWGATGTVPRRMRTARANADGSYLFPALPPGDYYLVALHETFEDEWRDPAFLETLSRTAEQIQLAEGERKTQDLRTATLR